MTEPTIAQAVDTYLRNKQATLWADFDISSPGDPRFNAAVRWLTAQVQAVLTQQEALQAETRSRQFRVLQPAGQQPERFTDEDTYETD